MRRADASHRATGAGIAGPYPPVVSPVPAPSAAAVLNGQLEAAHGVAMSILATVGDWSDALRDNDLDEAAIEAYVDRIARLGHVAVRLMTVAQNAVLSLERLEDHSRRTRDMDIAAHAKRETAAPASLPALINNRPMSREGEEPARMPALQKQNRTPCNVRIMAGTALPRRACAPSQFRSSSDSPQLMSGPDDQRSQQLQEMDIAPHAKRESGPQTVLSASSDRSNHDADKNVRASVLAGTAEAAPSGRRVPVRSSSDSPQPMSGPEGPRSQPNKPVPARGRRRGRWAR